jgi:hypothetical protein
MMMVVVLVVMVVGMQPEKYKENVDVSSEGLRLESLGLVYWLILASIQLLFVLLVV